MKVSRASSTSSSEGPDDSPASISPPTTDAPEAPTTRVWPAAAHAAAVTAIVIGSSLLHGGVIAERKIHRIESQMADGPYDVVVIGNSMVGEGVDPDLLARALDRPVTAVSHGGAATAWYFLALKNFILAADATAPDAVVLCFRDSVLTDPTYRTLGPYAPAVAALSSSHEPVLEELAWRPARGPVRSELFRRWAIYRDGITLHSLVDTHVRSVSAALTGVEEPEVRRALARELAEDRMIPELGADESSPRRAPAPRFDEVVGSSLLPRILDLARSRGVILVLVRYRKRRAAAGTPLPEDLVRYNHDLDRWAREHGVPLLDFSSEDRIALRHFAAGDHLSAEGRARFTELLAERLAPILPARGDD